MMQDNSTHRDKDLNFSVLFKRALLDWPEIVEVHLLLSSALHSDLYVVSGLGLKADEIAENYIGKPDEILMRNLHDAICSTIRSAAQFSTEVKLKCLRSEVIKENFENRLQRAILNPDLGWEGDDLILTRKYLTINKKT